MAERSALSVRALHRPAAAICNRPSTFRASATRRRADRSARSDSAPIRRIRGRAPIPCRSSSNRHALRLGGGLKYVRDHNPSMNYGRGAYFFAGAPDRFPRPYAFVQAFAPTPDRAVRRSAQHVGVRLRAGRLPRLGHDDAEPRPALRHREDCERPQLHGVDRRQQPAAAVRRRVAAARAARSCAAASACTRSSTCSTTSTVSSSKAPMAW